MQINCGDCGGVSSAPVPVAAALLQKLFAAYDSESLSAGALQQLLEAHAALGEDSKRGTQQGLQQELQDKLAQLRKLQQGNGEFQAQQQEQQQPPADPGLGSAAAARRAGAGAQLRQLPLHMLQLLGSDKGLLLAFSGLVKGMRAAEMNASSTMLRAVCEWGARLVLGPLALVQLEAVEAVGAAVWQLAGDDSGRKLMAANLSSGGIKLQAKTGERRPGCCAACRAGQRVLTFRRAVMVTLAVMLGGSPPEQCVVRGLAQYAPDPMLIHLPMCARSDADLLLLGAGFTDDGGVVGDSPLAMRHHSAGDGRVDMPQRPMSDGSEFSASLQRRGLQEVLLCEDEEEQRGSRGSVGDRGSCAVEARPPGMVSTGSLQEEDLAGFAGWAAGSSRVGGGGGGGSTAQARGTAGSTSSESAGAP
jgi:hypothetical protein